MLLVAVFLVPSLAIAAGPSFLTGPADGDAVDIVLDYVQSNRASLGLTEADLEGLRIEQYQTKQTGMTHVRLIQRFADIDVNHADILANVAADGSIINLHNRFVGGFAAMAGSPSPSLSVVEGVEAAANHLALTIGEAIVIETQDRDAELATVLNEAGISRRKIPAQLVWSNEKAVKLAWDMSIYETDRDHWWSLRVDAETGDVIEKVDWVVHETFQRFDSGSGTELAASTEKTAVASDPIGNYQVYDWPVESPNHAASAPPADARTIALDPHSVASPYGWHDTNGVIGPEFTTTEGNNVDAQKSGVEYDCGALLECLVPLDLTIEPTAGTNVDAAKVNLFYWNNVVHDVWYTYGFDEASRNFQVNNYGNGGVGNDSVIANAQASGNCNANFGTPSDGSAPTMNMFNCDIATPSRDGDFDNGVIAHEYGHGISNRLTGGASVSCLNNSEQMGEGWSDLFGLMMTMEPGDSGTDARGIGTWLLGEGPDGPGVRQYRYSTDMAENPHTYNNISSAAVPHGVGSVWAAMVWEMTWALIDEHGFNPDIYGAWNTGGNNLAMQLMMDGLKLQPCSPGFVDGRDAILLADQNLTGGANQCLIWAAFAKRGLGFSASQGSSSSTSDGSEAFDIPPSCDFLNPTPVSVDVCVGNDADFSVDVNDAFTPPVTLSATGTPAGSTTSFSTNPVSGPLPAVAGMTIGSIGAGAVGDYSIVITGNDGINNEGTTVGLSVYPTTLAAPALAAPADGSINLGPKPTLSWSAVVGTASYLVEIDDDPAFGSVDYSVSVNGTVHDVASFLDALTTYYWRATPSNLCTTGPPSSAFSFTTANIACETYSSLDVPSPIPAGGGTSGSMTSTLDIVDSGEIVGLTVTLAGTHTYMGDLDFNLDSPQATTVHFMDTGSCGTLEDFDLTLDDDAASAFPCPPTGGGTYLPTNPLAGFYGEDISGTWTMTIIDNLGGDSGSLSAWSLDICTSSPAVTPVIVMGAASMAKHQPTDWTKKAAIDLANVGGADLDWTIVEDGGANCDAPSDIPWLSGIAASAGTTGSGSTDSVLMEFDSTGLAIGQYSGNLCIDSNDPTTPRVVVPVTLNVVEPIFADQFRSGGWGAWDFPMP